MKLENKIAIVTGACSGIGKAIAEEFLKQGAFVVFSDINEIEINSENSFFIKCDVSKSEQVDNLIDETIKKFNKVDIMVNNAGIGTVGDVLSTNDDDWNKIISTNLSSVFYGMRAASNKMKEKGINGSIINITSILGTVGFRGAIGYCASKGGINQLTKAGALDLAPFNIRVNAIAPGFIKTQMTKGINEDANLKSYIEQKTPLGHMGEPIDIAKGAVYLASEDAKYVTGNILYIDGGWISE